MRVGGGEGLCGYEGRGGGDRMGRRGQSGDGLASTKCAVAIASSLRPLHTFPVHWL